MLDLLIRCSSLGKIMTEPKTKAEGILSIGAKTYIRELVAQEIFGVQFEIGGKPLEKGIVCEPESLALLNRVRGLQLVKNTDRRSNGWLTGEADIFDGAHRRGHDLKTSWSLATFPILPIDCTNKIYEWQMRGYMVLWDAEEWEVDYCMVSTPEDLIGYEDMQIHLVDHIPENHRVTSWVIQRDRSLEPLMKARVQAAQSYAYEVLREFDRTHALLGADPRAPWLSDVPAQATPAPSPAPAPAARPTTTELELNF